MGFAVAITDGMLHKIVPFLIWFHRFSTFGWQSEGTSSKRCFAGKTNKKPITTVGLALLILLPGALLQIDLLVRIGEICSMAAYGWLGLNLLYAIRQKPVPNDQ